MLLPVARPVLYTAGLTSQSVAFFHTLSQGRIGHWSAVETAGSLNTTGPLNTQSNISTQYIDTSIVFVCNIVGDLGCLVISKLEIFTLFFLLDFHTLGLLTNTVKI